jgi:hypothetical protein
MEEGPIDDDNVIFCIHDDMPSLQMISSITIVHF